MVGAGLAPLLGLAFLLLPAAARMMMDEESCRQVEEQQCGLCHTVYMEECGWRQQMQMMPKKVSVCKNVTR